MEIARAAGFFLPGSIVSLNGVYDCGANRKAFFNRSMTRNNHPSPRCRKHLRRGRKPPSDTAIFEERFRTIKRVFAWEDEAPGEGTLTGF